MFDALTKRDLPEMPAVPERISPLLYAAGLIGIGAALLWAKPRIGQVPNPTFAEGKTRSRRRRMARSGRDAVGALAPSNVTDSMGRSLIVGGVALMLARLLDEAS